MSKYNHMLKAHNFSVEKTLVVSSSQTSKITNSRKDPLEKLMQQIKSHKFKQLQNKNKKTGRIQHRNLNILIP